VSAARSTQFSRVSVIPVTISTNGFVWSCRTRAPVGPQIASLNRAVSRASALHFRSDVNSSRVGNWRSQPLERCTPYVSVPGWLRHLLPSGRDMLSGISNLRGGFKALRSLLPSNPLIPLRQEPTSGRFKGFFFPPVPLLSALHVRNMQQRNVQDHGKSHHNHG